MKVLLTGGTGLIGRALLPRLDKKYEIRIFGRTKPEPKYEFIKGELENSTDVQKATRDIEAVIHLGAVLAGQDPIKTIDVNVKGTLNVLEAAVKNNVKRIVFASSILVIGDIDYLPIDEEHPCKPKNIYGLSGLFHELCYVFA